MKWVFLPILFLSILACATDRTVTQTPTSNVPSQDVTPSVLQTLTFSEEAGYTRIRLEGSEPLSPPIYQVLSNPLRIVIDLPHVDLKRVKEPVKIENGTIGEVWATQYDDKGRIEIHLIQMANYNITREDRILSIDVEQVKQAEEKKEEKPEIEAVKEKETEVTPVDVKTESPVPVATEKTASPPVGEGKETKAKTLTDLSFEKKDDSVSFNIVADGRIGNYDSFKLESPPRLVIDLWEVNLRLDRKRLKFQNDFIKEIRLGQYPNKVRLVFDSQKSSLPPYQINRMEDRIVVSFGNVPQPSGPQIVLQEKVTREGGPQKGIESQAEPVPASIKKAPPTVTPASKGKAGTLTGIDFKQFDQKSRIVVSATGEPEVESLLISKKILAFNLKNTIIPKYLRRDLDTSEFKSAVQSIQLQNIKRGKTNDARILVKLREEVPYETSREGKSLFIDIENPKAIDAKGETREAAASAPVKEESPPQGVKKEEAKTEEVKKEEPKKEEVAKKEEGTREEAKIPPETKTTPKEASGMPPGCAVCPLVWMTRRQFNLPWKRRETPKRSWRKPLSRKRYIPEARFPSTSRMPISRIFSA